MAKWTKYTAEMINKVLQGVLSGKGNLYVSYGEKYDVNPAFAAAISCWESDYGRSKAAKNQNNVFGMMAPGAKIMSFSSVEEGIERGIKNLRNTYLNDGLTNAAAIQKRYAPVGSGNDPNNLNSQWLGGVEGIYKKITGESLNGADLGEGASSYAANASSDSASSGGGGGSRYLKTTRSWKTNPKTDWLLDPSDEERKYGINIYDGEQPLIKFSTYKAISEHGDYVGALKKYCEFLFYLLNSEVTTAQITCIGMPWIRPGFNVWYDPINADAIYYCTNVQQQGTPTTGAMTSLTLVLGRDRKAYISDADRFGSFKDRSDNVFISDMKDEYRVAKFGECLTTLDSFENIKTASINYYNEEQFDTMDAKDSDFHKNIYVNGGDKSPAPENINKDKVFSGTYTEDEINKQLESMYSKAPDVVNSRRKQLKEAVLTAKKFFDEYRILETHTFG